MQIDLVNTTFVYQNSAANCTSIIDSFVTGAEAFYGNGSAIRVSDKAGNLPKPNGFQASVIDIPTHREGKDTFLPVYSNHKLSYKLYHKQKVRRRLFFKAISGTYISLVL